MLPNVTQSFTLHRTVLESCRAEAMLRLSIAEHYSKHATDAIGNPERHMRKASHCGSKQQ